MTAVMVHQRLESTAYTASDLWTDLKQTIPSYFQSTSTAFCRVVVHKLDENGNPRTLHYPNMNTKEVRVRGPEFSYVLNKQTRKLYYDEPGFVISIKCLVAFFATPIYILINIVWSVHQIFHSLYIIAHNAFHLAKDDFIYGRFYDAARILAKEIQPFPSILKERLFAIVRAPLLGVGMLLSTALGVLRPLHGRQWMAMFEKALHDGASYHDNLCKVLLSKKEVTCASFCKDIHLGKPFFLTYCFLERGVVDDQKHFQVIRYTPVQSYFGNRDL